MSTVEIPSSIKVEELSWREHVKRELEVAQIIARQNTYNLNTVTAKIGNVGEPWGPETHEEWNVQDAIEAAELTQEAWLADYPTTDLQIAAMVDMIEKKEHGWYGFGKYFKEIALGEPIVSDDIHDHLGLLDVEIIEPFRVPEGSNTRLHFSFLDEDEKGEQNKNAPVTAFFTDKVASIPLNVPRPSEVAIYKQLRFVMNPELLAELHSGLRKAVEPLALENNENLTVLLQEPLAEAMMEAEASGIAPIVSRYFMQAESIKSSFDDDED